jgi:hypothetical protein
VLGRDEVRSADGRDEHVRGPGDLRQVLGARWQTVTVASRCSSR